MDHHLTTVLVLVAALGVASQWLAWRMRIPAIVLLLATGVLAGPVFGVVRPGRDLGAMLEPVIALSVAVILFEGGLSLRLHELREAAAGVRRLVVLGVPLSFVMGTLAARYIGGLGLAVASVFGAIIVVTGPTVIMPLLRHARLRRRTASYLKWEGIVNDPIGALLTVLVFTWFSYGGSGAPTGEIVRAVLVTVGASLVLGGVVGWLLGETFRRGFIPEYLKAPAMLGTVLVVFLAAETQQEEAGLAAATVLGIVVGNQRLGSIEEIRRFKEYITVLLVSSVFVLLTANLEVRALMKLDLRAALLLVSLVFLVRPAAVFLSTIGAGMDLRDRVLVAWIAPRGVVAAAVAGAVAVPLAKNGHADSDLLVPLTFALIAVTVVLHGLTVSGLARRLGLASKGGRGLLLVGASPFTVELAAHLRELEVPVLIVDASYHRLRRPRMAGIPVHYGDLASEATEEAIELNELGALLAATGNDAYNAIVCQRVIPEFGRENVFQLPLNEKDEADPRGLHHAVRGRIAFGEGARLDDLLRKHYQGWTVQKTKLTEEFTPDDLLWEKGGVAIPLILVRPGGRLRVLSEANGPEPRQGDTVITFGPAAD